MKVLISLSGPFEGQDPGRFRTMTIGEPDAATLRDSVLAWVTDNLDQMLGTKPEPEVVDSIWDAFFRDGAA